ncbi:MAG: DUF3352 domain-containing protein [Actinobacteria bacterium]|nr:MAG: DUF3352 domain-containing protein [Actinomycetota bacterium]
MRRLRQLEWRSVEVRRVPRDQVRRVWAGAAAVAALAAAGCGSGGGGGGGSLPEGASIAPSSTPGFVSFNTDFSSDQWRNFARLAARFPAVKSSVAILKNFKPFAGKEVDLVWLDLRGSGGDYVVLTKPNTRAKLREFVHLQGDLFAQGSVGDLADDKDFKQAFEQLDSNASVRAWISGQFVQGALDDALANGGAPPRLTHDVGVLHSISADAKAESDGASIEIDGLIEPTPDPATFSPSLPNDIPDGALLYVSTKSLDAPLRTILRLVGESVPNFNTRRSQVEGVLGLSLENDIYPLLKGESAIAVYPGTAQIPRVLFLQKVDDEQKAASLLRRLSAIAQLSGSVKTETVQVGGESVQKLTFTGTPVTIYDGTAKGKLFVTNESSLAEQTITGPTDSLGDDPLFRSTRDAAGMPGKVAAFAFGDLENGLPYVLRLAQQAGNVVPPEAFANTKPLDGAVVYLVKDGDALRISGFQTIK